MIFEDDGFCIECGFKNWEPYTDKISQEWEKHFKCKQCGNLFLNAQEFSSPFISTPDIEIARREKRIFANGILSKGFNKSGIQIYQMFTKCNRSERTGSGFSHHGSHRGIGIL